MVTSGTGHAGLGGLEMRSCLCICVLLWFNLIGESRSYVNSTNEDPPLDSESLTAEEQRIKEMQGFCSTVPRLIPQVNEEVKQRLRMERQNARLRIKMRNFKREKYSDLCRCMVSGDPHYKTFDGAVIHFQGTSEYLLAGSKTDEGNCTFDVTVENEERYDRHGVSFTKQVNIHMWGITVSLLKNNILLIHGIRHYPPVHDEDRFDVVENTRAIVFISNCGIQVSFQDNSRVEVYVPKQFAGNVTGICGTCNGNLTDDYQLADGTPVQNNLVDEHRIGDSYAVARAVLEDGNQINLIDGPLESLDNYLCSDEAWHNASEACHVMIRTDGPFGECCRIRGGQCREYYDGCVQDYCAFSADPGMSGPLLCRALSSLAEECWENGIEVHWRSLILCPPTCPANSYYTDIMPACPPSCAEPEPTGDCVTDTEEGCVCNEGFLLNEYECVPKDQCGCVDPNTKRYYPPNQRVLSRSCNTAYTCVHSNETQLPNLLEEPTSSCHPSASCSLVDGLRTCVCPDGFDGDGYDCLPTYHQEEQTSREEENAKERERRETGYCECIASGDLHISTYDDQLIHFQGDCTYILSRFGRENDTCFFSLTVKTHHHNISGDASFTRDVNVHIGNSIISLLSGDEVWVNGQQRGCPVTCTDDGFSVIQSGQMTEVLTRCGVDIAFDGRHMVIVRIPRSQGMHVDGMCGNCDSVQNDFRTQDGRDVSEMENRFSLIGESYIELDPYSEPDLFQQDNSTQCSKAPVDVMCSQEQMSVAMDQCARIVDFSGPFRECISRIEERILAVMESCIQDLCDASGDEARQRELLCMNLEWAAATCESSGIMVDWRGAAHCLMNCSEHSHYNPLMSGCQPSCLGPPPDECRLAEREGCECDPGYVLDNGKCIQEEDCGCYHTIEGYIPIETHIYSENCVTRLDCLHYENFGVYLITSLTGLHACSEDAYCTVKDSEPQCLCKPGYIGTGHICYPLEEIPDIIPVDPLPDPYVEIAENPEIVLPNLNPGQQPGEFLLLNETEEQDPNLWVAPPLLEEPVENNQTSQDSEQPLTDNDPSDPTGPGHLIEGLDAEDVEDQTEATRGSNGDRQRFDEAMPDPVTHEVTQPKPVSSNANDECMCTAHGDPHFRTFDGAHLQVFSPCKYIMAETSVSDHPCSFRVDVTNEIRPETGHPNRAYIGLVDVILPADTISLHAGGTVQLNGDDVVPAFVSHDALVVRDGEWANVTTACNVSVAYDGKKRVVVKMPAEYRSWSRGICGDCDNNTSNDVTVDGVSIYSFDHIGQGYRALARKFLIPGDPNDSENAAICQQQNLPQK